MKKTLLAAALLAGYTGAAVAENSVTLYGRINPAFVYESVKFSQGAADFLNSQTGISGVEAKTYSQVGTVSGYAPGGAHWGLKGVEDIGNGLKVGFALEEGVDLDNGSASGFTRKSYLSVSSSSWGTVHVGRDFVAGDTILAGISPLGTAYGVGSAEPAFGTFSMNVGNQVKYLSPSFSGLTVGLSYSFADSSIAGSTQTFGTANKNRMMGAGLRYANGPILVAANYVQLNPANNNLNNGNSPKNWVIGGSYDFKVVKVHAAYGQNIDGIVNGQSAVGPLGGASGGDFGVIGSGGIAADGRTDQWMAGLSAPVGEAGKAMFSISQQRPGGAFDNSNTGTMTNLGVVYSYSLSKRTSLYASYSYARNYLMVDGVTVNQVGAGVVHLF